MTTEEKRIELEKIGLYADSSEKERINDRYDRIIAEHGTIEQYLSVVNGSTKGMDASDKDLTI